jgi:hypothetical protein
MAHTDRPRRPADAFRRRTGISPAAFDRPLGEREPRYAADARRNPRRWHPPSMKNVAGRHNRMFA